MFNLKGINSRQAYDLEGLRNRIECLAGEKPRASGITEKRLRLLASLEVLKSDNGDFNSLKSKKDIDLKKMGIASKFVRDAILNGGLQGNINDAFESVRPNSGNNDKKTLSDSKTQLVEASIKRVRDRSTTDAARQKYANKITSFLGSPELSRPKDSLIQQFSSAIAASEKEKLVSNFYNNHPEGFEKDLEDLKKRLPSSLTEPQIQDLANKLVAVQGLNAKDAMRLLMQKGAESEFSLLKQGVVTASEADSEKIIKVEDCNAETKGYLLEALTMPNLSRSRDAQQIKDIFSVLKEKYLDETLFSTVKAMEEAVAIADHSSVPVGQDIFLKKLASSMSMRKDATDIARLVKVGKDALAPVGQTTPAPVGSRRPPSVVEAPIAASTAASNTNADEHDAVAVQRQTWLEALNKSSVNEDGTVVLLVPTIVGAGQGGGRVDAASTGLTGQTESTMSQSRDRSLSKDNFFQDLWSQVPEALKYGENPETFKQDFMTAAENLCKKLFPEPQFFSANDSFQGRETQARSSWEATIHPDKILIKKKI
ncbi:MAG: hypothetical protein LW629_13055 [Burkholderiales bacterium]|nr:hypothetical protein [Burkholderiales bacterium]